MPRPNKKSLKAKKAGIVSAQKRKNISQQGPVKVNARTFTFSVLANGGTYTKQRRIANDMNIIVPSSTSFYKHQKVILREAKAMAEDSMFRARSTMRPHSSISFDGHYSHPRNANECAVDILDERGLIVQHQVKTRIRSIRKGNYSGPSNMMESAALREAIGKLDNQLFDCYVHDRDNKSTKIIDELRPGKKEFYDPNHASKGFDRCWKKLVNGGYRSKTAKTSNEENAKKPFLGLGEKLKTWFCFLLYSLMSIPMKIFKRKNSINHFLYDHSKCDPPHPQGSTFYIWQQGANNIQYQNELSAFLNETSTIFETVDKTLTTNRNESFHSEAAKFAPKSYAWCGSYEGRMDLAICSHNDPTTWKDTLRRRVNADKLSPQAQFQVDQLDNAKMKKQEMRHNDEYRLKERARRNSFKRTKKGDYGE